MPTIIIHQTGKITQIETAAGDILLDVLRNNGYNVFSPCGGKGTCGKCKVRVLGEGMVSSCLYNVYKSIEIELPDKREAKVLVEQHAHTIDLPFSPGLCTGLSPNPYGVAIDIGTTSIVFYLVNMITGSIVETRAILNPQARYGADVISRIQYTSDHNEGLQILQTVILDAMNKELKHLIGFSQISQYDLVKITIAGNTTMLHLLLGVNPRSLALAPFKAQFLEEKILKGKDLNLFCHDDAEIKVLPSFSAFVGADIVAGLASIAPSEKHKNFLFMDIGTNGELALVTGDRIWCCATAAGPAFEGARITNGMGAIEGAISAYDNAGITVIGDKKPIGICGSGVIDIVAWLIEKKITDRDGLLKDDFIIVTASESETGQNIIFTQKDIREVQLAKSAIASGIILLLKHSGLSFEQVDTLFLAGGFGNYINTENAVKIGLIPQALKDKIIPLGNTSGAGALAALKSVIFDDVMNELILKSTLVDLAGDDDFALEFAMNMMF